MFYFRVELCCVSVYAAQRELILKTVAKLNEFIHEQLGYIISIAASVGNF